MFVLAGKVMMVGFPAVLCGPLYVKVVLPSIQPLCYLAAMRSILLVLALLAFGVIAEAQQAANVTPIGYLATSPLSVNAARHAAFRQGLRELGYVEGKNIVL